MTPHERNGTDKDAEEQAEYIKQNIAKMPFDIIAKKYKVVKETGDAKMSNFDKYFGTEGMDDDALASARQRGGSEWF
jgi:hypothetical protein